MNRFEVFRAPLVALAVLSVSMNVKAQSSGRGPKAKPPEAPAKKGTTGDLLPFRAAERTLPNGLRAIVVPTGFPNLVSIQIPVRTGSRNEVEPGKSGFAHFFEHMMFRGTPSYPPERYQEALARAGARSNAYTTDDYTNYHVTFAKEDLETILGMEADRFQNLSYSEAAFRTEARAVLGEYNKNSADPVNKLLEVQREHAYTAHTYRHTTMGFLKDVEDMPNQFEYSKTFFDRWYRPEHTTVLVAGDVEPEAVFALVAKHWGAWKRGSYTVDIPREPEPRAPVYAHVPWDSSTLPWVAVAFRGPAFSDTEKDYAATDMLLDLTFGETSELYKRLVEEEQTVDQLFTYNPATVDPSLMTVLARLKRPEDAVRVRDEILKAFAATRAGKPAARRLADARSNARYSLVRSLDDTEHIAGILARFVRYDRSYETLNRLYRVYDALTPDDLLSAARRYFADERLVITTLSSGALAGEIGQAPRLDTLAQAGAAGEGPKVVTVGSTLPQVRVKLLFRAGSAHDPAGKEGLAALSAAMIAEAGSRSQRIDEVRKALYPMAGSFDDNVDKEVTTFTASVHRDNWDAFAEIVLPQLLEPGFREEDFRRLRDAQLNALTVDLRSNNEEELAKERLQANIFAGTRYGQPALGTVAGLKAITLDDVKAFVGRAYTRPSLTVGLSGDAPPDLLPRLERELDRLPEGPALPPPEGVDGKTPEGIEVEIIQKETRATAISFGHPIEVTRSHPDFAALLVARTWLGEHRSSQSHLFKRIREARGMNYGDYAYIEAFPRGMFQFFPDPNVVRRAQIFEVWIRPVMPQNAHMALRIAIHELQKLVRSGIGQEDFEATRNYLMKNVYLLTATQEQQLGYALDSDWYGIGEYTQYLRERLGKLTRDDVNRAIHKHLSAEDLSVVIVTKDARGLRDALVLDTPSPVKYDGEKPAELLAEDKIVGAKALGIRPEAVRITPVEEVFAGAAVP